MSPKGWLPILVAAACAPALAVGCFDGASSDRGLAATLQVSGAQYFEGAPPKATGGPKVEALNLSKNVIFAGEVGQPFKGALDPAATSVAIGLEGDPGYWVLVAGLPDVAAPTYPTFTTELSFAETLTAGPHTLWARAVDDSQGEARFGPAETSDLTAIHDAGPGGDLVVSLRWDTEADLDLHLVDPSGVEIWKGNINSLVIDPFNPPPDGGPTAGILDFDSNAGCVIDGRRQEDVVYAGPPPSGHYTVRVDTFDLCGESFADWRVDVVLRGQTIGSASGESTADDQDQVHGLGQGVLALSFDVP